MTDNILNDGSVDSSVMSILDHLDELRRRLYVCFWFFILGFIVCFIFSRDLIGVLKCISPVNVQYIQIAPGEVFIASVRIALYSAIYFASPVIIYQLLAFLSPGLHNNEKRFVIPVSIAAFLFFSIGICFGYFVMAPLALNFLLNYGSDIAVNAISISKYVAFNAAIILGMGLLFQIPLVLVFLAIINVVTSSKLMELWRYIIILAFVIGAIVTPSPDPFPQIIVAAVVLGLYYLSILLLKIIRK